jgi:DMSO/TMAO reductase YedYZ molybdopterin-dependent catalytic subunit
MFERSLRISSLLALAIVALNHAAHYAFGLPLATDRIAEWIMARTPNSWAVPILSELGEWAKPFAATGGLAAIGFGSFLATYLAFLLARSSRPVPPSPARRGFLAAAVPALMAAGTAGVAVESWARNRAYASKAVEPIDLWPHRPPDGREDFAPGLVRPSVTSVEAFYGMSKNTVDPVIDPRSWQLSITLDGRPLRSYSYAELLSLPRLQRYTTMRCVSNTLTSNLMGTAEWSGVLLRQLIDPASVSPSVAEIAFIGSDGHDDSLPASYAFSEELLLALGMNGKTLNRVHGFPFRLIAPRYYGFKSVKWMSEIRLCTKPYFGTWPKMGYTKEPVVHTMSYVDRVRRENGVVLAGGVAFSGALGIERVEIRAGDGPWTPAQLEAPLSPYTWTRWKVRLESGGAAVIEARALARDGRWQAVKETPLFPNGVAGPTIKKLT